MKKIDVKQDACIGCGACVAIDPEHFAFNDEGLSHPISNESLESADLMNAIDSCPTSAISIKESEDTDCNCENDDCKCGDDCNCENDDCKCGDDCNCTKESNCGCCHNCENEEE